MYIKFVLCKLAFLLAVLVNYEAQAFGEDGDAASIDIVYHIATLNNWENVVSEQLETLEKSGLGQACDSMTVTVVGTQFEKVNPLFANLTFLDKVTIIHASPDVHQFEFPGIEKTQEIAQKKPNSKILYFHTKGITHFYTPNGNNSRLWRLYMDYFAVECWRDCVDALDHADICGVDLSTCAIGVYFSGNFWWARASYLCTCKLERSSRYSCESFIGTGNNPIAKSFHQSGENPLLMNKYTYKDYPQFFYADPSYPYFQGIMKLYSFPYLAEYYRKP